MSSPTVHAVLSPSSMNRIIHCPPSAKINAEAPESTSVYAEEGTIAHMLCEEYTRAFFSDAEVDPDIELAARDALAALGEKYPGAKLDSFDKMSDYAMQYRDHIADIADSLSPNGNPYVVLERKLDMGEWAPGCFGTSDCIVIGGSTLAVVDFKYGQGVVVSADHNPQMMTYALGALSAYDMIYDIQKVEMYIIQPRIASEPSYCVMPVEELRTWATDVLAPAAKLAAEGKGEFSSGSWCKFCAIAGNCRARAERYTKELADKRKTSPLSNAEVAEAITIGDGLAEWLKDIQGYALKQCLAGVDIPGYKAIAGRLGNRNWSNAEKAFNTMIESGIPEEMLYERTPKSLANIEKDCFSSKKAFTEAMGEFVVQAPGAPKLVPASDKHPAITNKPSVEEDFG